MHLSDATSVCDWAVKSFTILYVEFLSLRIQLSNFFVSKWCVWNKKNNTNNFFILHKLHTRICFTYHITKYNITWTSKGNSGTRSVRILLSVQSARSHYTHALMDRCLMLNRITLTRWWLCCVKRWEALFLLKICYVNSGPFLWIFILQENYFIRFCGCYIKYLPKLV